MTIARIVSGQSELSFAISAVDNRDGTWSSGNDDKNVLANSTLLRVDVIDRLKKNNDKKVIMHHVSGMINDRAESVDYRGESTNETTAWRRQESTNETLLDGIKRIQNAAEKQVVPANNHGSVRNVDGNLMLGLLDVCQIQRSMHRSNHYSARIPEIISPPNRS